MARAEGEASQGFTGCPDLSVDARRAMEVLFRLQVTARSTLGALALRCGGVLLDHGWLRLLGGGGDELMSLAEANGLGEPMCAERPAALTVAFDVLVLAPASCLPVGGIGCCTGNCLLVRVW